MSHNLCRVSTQITVKVNSTTGSVLSVSGERVIALCYNNNNNNNSNNNNNNNNV